MAKSTTRLLPTLIVAIGLCVSSTALSQTTNPAPDVQNAADAPGYTPEFSPSPLSGMLALPPGTLLPPSLKPKGDLGQAVMKLKQGDYSAARRELQAFETAENSPRALARAHYVRAHLEEAQGSHERAIQSFRAVGFAIAELIPLSYEGQGRNLAQLERYKEAAEIFARAARKTTSSQYAHDLTLKAVENYLEIGYATRAKRLMAPLKEDLNGPALEEIDYYEAHALAIQGHRAQSITALRTLQREATQCDVIRQAGHLLADIHAPISNPKSISKEMERARRLTRCALHDDAKTILESLAPHAPATSLEEAWLSLWYAQWEHGQILSYTNARLDGPIDDAGRSRMLRWQARATWREGEPAKAADLRQASIRLSEKKPDWKDTYAAAGLYAEAHDYAKARPMFRSLLKKRLPRSKRIECLWHLAWADVVEGHLDTALTGMENLANRYPNEKRGQAAKYWLVRLNILEGHGEAAIQWLENLKTETPDSFYTFLASALELEKAALQLLAVDDRSPRGLPAGVLWAALPQDAQPFHPLALPASTPWRLMTPEVPVPGSSLLLDLPTPLRPAPPADLQSWEAEGEAAFRKLVGKYGRYSPELKMALALSDAGFYTEAGQWLVYVYEKQANKAPANQLGKLRKERTLLYASMWYLKQPLHTLRLDPTGWPFPKYAPDAPEIADKWRHRYPRAYAHGVADAHIVWGVDPSLIYGVMRTESAYGTYQQSQVGARGLMQIMPATGARIAAMLGEAFQPQDLFDPQRNIYYGAWYLSQLLERFDGQLPLAVAAYNAGPKYVSRWSHRHANTPIDLFIEEIPITQTRDYVKKVLRAMSLYRGLYSSGQPIPLRPVVSPAMGDGINF